MHAVGRQTRRNQAGTPGQAGAQRKGRHRQNEQKGTKGTGRHLLRGRQDHKGQDYRTFVFVIC
jgi:hypothetical protein